LQAFDHFMGIKFPSFKRYGLEGSEAIMPGLNAVFGWLRRGAFHPRVAADARTPQSTPRSPHLRTW
jgi:hypothetical protein